ncbi:UNVERIFIED_CONTAM: hypothetical protein GTU68_043925 [Idotea baltica]|nr:hypothetical protein [Idotea baltica]
MITLWTLQFEKQSRLQKREKCQWGLLLLAKGLLYHGLIIRRKGCWIVRHMRNFWQLLPLLPTLGLSGSHNVRCMLLWSHVSCARVHYIGQEWEGLYTEPAMIRKDLCNMANHFCIPPPR